MDFLDPPQLSEARALVLLRQHCSVLRGRLVFDASRERGAHIKQKWMTLLCIDVTPTELRAGLGFELRVAIDVLNALCACRGFVPHHNGRFWREAVSSLWIVYKDPDDRGQRLRLGYQDFQPPPEYMLPFDSAAFSCFTLDIENYPPSESATELAEMWKQIAWVDAQRQCPRAILKSHTAVLTQLRRFAVYDVRRVHLELKIPDNVDFWDGVYEHRRTVPVRWDWRLLNAALQACAADTPSKMRSTRNRLASNLQTPPEISIAIRNSRECTWCFALFTSNLRQARRLVASSPSSIRCLTFDVAFQEDASQPNQLVWLGELLRTLLLDTQSLQTLRLAGNCHAHVVAAACSVVPFAPSLQEVVVHCYDDEVEACWLLYAVQHPHRVARVLPRLRLYAANPEGPTEYNEQRVKAREAAQQRGTPLEQIARRAVAEATASRLDKVPDSAFHWFASGTTITRVRTPKTTLFASLLFVKKVWKPMDQGTELEAVVAIASMGAVGVVARGWGLCWVHAGDVDVEYVPQSHPAPLVIEHLSLAGHDWDLVTAWARTINGSSFRSLELIGTCFDDKYADELALVLECCPNLESLILEYCYVETLLPLVRAYESRNCRITSLSLATFGSIHGKKILGLDELMAMLTKPHHPGSRTLRHLCVSRVPDLNKLATKVARILKVNRTLESVFIAGGLPRMWAVSQLSSSSADKLAAFHDQVLTDATAAALGLLSVVYHGGRTGGSLGAVDALIMRTVMAFVGPTRRRSVRWLNGDERCFSSLVASRFY